MSWTIKNTEHFKTQYKLLPRQIQTLAKGVFELLEDGPYDSSFRLHALGRPLSKYHGISVNEEYRMIVRILPDKEEIILHDIGTHEIYRSFY